MEKLKDVLKFNDLIRKQAFEMEEVIKQINNLYLSIQ
jgi:hypothetical protein